MSHVTNVHLCQSLGKNVSSQQSNKGDLMLLHNKRIQGTCTMCVRAHEHCIPSRLYRSQFRICPKAFNWNQNCIVVFFPAMGITDVFPPKHKTFPCHIRNRHKTKPYCEALDKHYTHWEWMSTPFQTRGQHAKCRDRKEEGMLQWSLQRRNKLHWNNWEVGLAQKILLSLQGLLRWSSGDRWACSLTQLLSWF